MTRARYARALVAVLLGVAVLACAEARANTVVTIRDYDGDPHEMKITPGHSVDLYIEISTDVSLISGQHFIHEWTQSGMITINSVTWNSAKWDPDEAVYNPAGELPNPPYGPWTLDASNNFQVDVGTFANDVFNGTGTGTFLFLTMNITLSEQASGGAAYRLELLDLAFGTPGGGDSGAIAGPAFDIIVLPAPGAVVLGAMGLAFVGWLKRRQPQAA